MLKYYVQDIVNPAEGESVIVECEVEAVPAEESIEWTGPNGFVSRGATLSLPSVTRYVYTNRFRYYRL